MYNKRDNYLAAFLVAALIFYIILILKGYTGTGVLVFIGSLAIMAVVVAYSELRKLPSNEVTIETAFQETIPALEVKPSANFYLPVLTTPSVSTDISDGAMVITSVDPSKNPSPISIKTPEKKVRKAKTLTSPNVPVLKKPRKRAIKKADDVEASVYKAPETLTESIPTNEQEWLAKFREACSSRYFEASPDDQTNLIYFRNGLSPEDAAREEAESF